VEVVVSVAAGHLASIGEVAGALRDAGLRDAQILEAVGVITGHVDDAVGIEPLQQVDGVAGAEASRTIDLPPPDAPVQ
jgi:hypothetical protein